MNQEQKSKEQEAAEEKYPIWPNKFKDKDEWLPEEIAKCERAAFIAGIEYAQQREQPAVQTRYNGIVGWVKLDKCPSREATYKWLVPSGGFGTGLLQKWQAKDFWKEGSKEMWILDETEYAQQSREQQWVPLNSESMPERSEPVLFFNEDGLTWIGHLDKDDEDFIRGNGHWEETTHWQKLPPAPLKIKT